MSVAATKLALVQLWVGASLCFYTCSEGFCLTHYTWCLHKLFTFSVIEACTVGEPTPYLEMLGGPPYLLWYVERRETPVSGHSLSVKKNDTRWTGVKVNSQGDEFLRHLEVEQEIRRVGGWTCDNTCHTGLVSQKRLGKRSCWNATSVTTGRSSLLRDERSATQYTRPAAADQTRCGEPC